MKTIGEITIEKRDNEVIDITIPNTESNDTTFGITKNEAIGIAYYLLGLTESMEDHDNV